MLSQYLRVFAGSDMPLEGDGVLGGPVCHCDKAPVLAEQRQVVEGDALLGQDAQLVLCGQGLTARCSWTQEESRVRRYGTVRSR